MVNQPIDFQKIFSDDLAFIDELQLFLKERESETAIKVSHALQPIFQQEIPVESLSLVCDSFRKATKAIEAKPTALPTHWQSLLLQIENALWECAESLKESVMELFYRLSQLGVEKWNATQIQVVTKVKELLLDSLLQLKRSLYSLESSLREYQLLFEEKFVFIKRLCFFFSSLLDKNLLKSVKSAESFLKLKFENYIHRYEAYTDLKKKLENSLVKFSTYKSFNSLSKKAQEEFRSLYYLIKFWKCNEKTQSVPQEQIVKSLRSDFDVDKVTKLFRLYYQAISESFFRKCREIKKSEFSNTVEAKRELKEDIQRNQAELHTLAATISRYREFSLGTDPDPYVSTKWGFTEWVVGPEPAKVKQLLRLGNEIQSFDTLFKPFIASLERGSQDLLQNRREYKKEMLRNLHELGQPLISYGTKRTRLERFLLAWKELDEAGSLLPEVVDDVHQLLLRAFRLDAKDYILHDIPLFHQLYMIHRGILGRKSSPAHEERLSKFRRLTEEIEQWVIKRETAEHRYQIDRNVNEIRREMQAFIALLESESRPSADCEQELIDYRYFFGRFFHFLRQHEVEGKLIRQQFQFLSHLFEQAEGAITEL